jgi:hypothetical protein
MQNFWQKGIHSPFWILASRGKKKPKSPHLPHEKFGILDGTKHTRENFQSSWHFAFCIPWETKHSHSM